MTAPSDQSHTLSADIQSPLLSAAQQTSYCVGTSGTISFANDWQHKHGSYRTSVDSFGMQQQQATATRLASMRKRFSILSAAGERFQKNTLSALSVVAIAFFNVSGGPWGSEPMFQPGPFYGVLGIVGVTLFYGLPQSLVTAELSAAFPVNGGYSVWVTEAFGPVSGMLECYFSWVSGVIDNAIYPVLIFDSASHLFGHITYTNANVIKILIVLVLAAPNLLSTSGTARMLECLSVLCLLPFAVFIIVALPQIDINLWTEDVPSPEDVNWNKWIMVVFWNLSGWDCVSTIAGEVANPAFNMICALMVSLVFTAVQYILILGTAAGLEHRLPFAEWKDGSLTEIITLSCGTWMGSFLLMACILGNTGMFVAELTEDSYQLQGMADHGRSVLPRVLAWKHPKYQTPWGAIGLSLICIIPAVCFDFSQLLAINNCFSSAAALLEFAAYGQLVRNGNLLRPYKAPKWVMIIGVPMASLVGLLVFYQCLMKSTHAFILNVTAMLLGVPLSYFIAYPPWTSSSVGSDDSGFSKF
eukprot:GEMP01015425.1.p1 GENE.GEMP01015425.1~~GEMP01015425.1.p1  ORF type:complete len:528 (+),score=101.66 GEMP01015425.1:168-1751(+)